MTIECAYEIISLLLDENKNENVEKALETIKESAQVVRCKDCRWIERCGVSDSFFCADGERKNDDKTKNH